ncbi:MAG: DUF2083 domain-containing protein [Maritimibacter sp.]|nr:DUF2083 domain-containing protein [Maritimibacter sp.]
MSPPAPPPAASGGPQARLTGSRIRERRLARGTRQADLAKTVGISPAYLNLIEHNRRRIGGKLVVDLARALGVEPAQLTEGAEDALVTALREAGARAGPPGQTSPVSEREPPEDFATRFPGWAGLVAGQARRIGELERLVETLTDRLAHDPHLAAALHEVLSAVTAIRSAAAILSDPDIDAEWRARFLRSVREESRRLSESAEGLVTWLDTGADFAETALSPVDQLGVFAARSGYRFDPLERPGAGHREIETLVSADPALIEAGAGELAHALLARYLADARAMPAEAFAASRAAAGDDPARLAAAFGVGVDAVLRRIAALGGDGAGLVTCDGAGVLTLRKPVEGFALPRFGAGCPLWPLYQALSRPAQPVSCLVEMPGRVPRRFRARAVAQVMPGTGFATPPALEATMLIEPVEDTPEPAIPMGSACRVCPRDACPARREPSILSAEAG